ncbi:hypothetical protein [Limnobaculum xujianqingii]|nr:hypothetical protein [Limnobaculum xujianqingii]
MNLDGELLELLRNHASKGQKVSSLIKIIQDYSELNDFNSFLVMNYFMQAFNLSVNQVRELSGAFCLGGGVYSDEDINTIIYRQIMINSSSTNF